jgi:hypothetical protein
MLASSERPNQLPAEPDPIRLDMTFEVVRADLPVVELRHSRKIWNHVDESQSDPRQIAFLARNGLRLGKATVDAWPAIRAILEAHHAKSLTARHTAQSSAPLSLRLGDLAAPHPVFLLERDGSLVGKTYQGGVKFLHLDYALDPADPQRTAVRVTPEIRKFSADKHWQDVDGRLVEATRYEGRFFSELAADVAIGPGEFLVIGPSEISDLPYLVGSAFLTTEQNNVTYETVICVTPQPVRVERTSR